MAINSTGEKNRVAGRDFNENKIQIDKFDGRHTINIAIPTESDERRPLVKAQRKELNSLVAAIAEAGEDEAFVIWQKVHAEVGVASIDEMTVNQYQAAISFLQAILDRCKEKDASRVLVSLLLRNSEENEFRQKLIRYCHVNFGTGRLNDLTRSQLQMALSWLDQQQTSDIRKPSNSSAMKIDFIHLLKSYPKEFALIFVVGIAFGAFVF
ncbi:hypothetical protein P5G64_01920 [Serratia nevei]|uniref:hypothetical protein n=1 Tax=Serratia marcescens TaxID=615 RepID=UPI00141D2CF0|nr:hypothetical protein [Serratia marcescens]MDF8320739.1 hypothetical protein [Serratia nevei]MDF8326253.1 hypothetical protein [Serratia nevei]MDF8336293.1 hypothetical protein [Serratia nevei]MDF8346106.1 hypothetical protein [Serratia nevei]MDF8347325.1 hypothetical protein [Serratia nevei]